MIHEAPSPLAARSVEITSGYLAGNFITIEDWWDRVAGRSWMDCVGNPACLNYAMMAVGAPINNEVLYGKIGGSGYLVHRSWIAADDIVAGAEQ